MERPKLLPVLRADACPKEAPLAAAWCNAAVVRRKRVVRRIVNYHLLLTEFGRDLANEFADLLEAAAERDKTARRLVAAFASPDPGIGIDVADEEIRQWLRDLAAGDLIRPAHAAALLNLGEELVTRAAEREEGAVVTVQDVIDTRAAAEREVTP